MSYPDSSQVPSPFKRNKKARLPTAPSKNIPFPAQVLPQDSKDTDPSFVPAHGVKCAELTQVTAKAGNPFLFFFLFLRRAQVRRIPKEQWRRNQWLHFDRYPEV